MIRGLSAILPWLIWILLAGSAALWESSSPQQLAILGFCLYMISDLVSPIYRHAYYACTVDHAAADRSEPLPAALEPAGVLGSCWQLFAILNVVHLPFVRMGNTVGEYGFLAGSAGDRDWVSGSTDASGRPVRRGFPNRAEKAMHMGWINVASYF
jgi:hypothetical protein